MKLLIQLVLFVPSVIFMIVGFFTALIVVPFGAGFTGGVKLMVALGIKKGPPNVTPP